MKLFVVYFRYQKPNEKKPGPVTHYRVEANSLEEAEEITRRQARYPGLEIIRIEKIRN